jgi:hypothetical protein
MSLRRVLRLSTATATRILVRTNPLPRAILLTLDLPVGGSAMVDQWPQNWSPSIYAEVLVGLTGLCADRSPDVLVGLDRAERIEKLPK